MILKILNVRDPRIRKKSKPVKKIDKMVKRLIADMRETLEAQKDPEGVGLAAPQVGKCIRIFLINHGKTEKVIINPKILDKKKPRKTKKKKSLLEGCLSLPHYYGPLVRASSVTISYQDETGKKKTEEFRGFLAQIVEHEIDHLEGTLFIDRILEQKVPLYKFKNDEWEEVELA